MTSNPIFRALDREVALVEGGQVCLTVDGTIQRSLILFGCVVTSALLTWEHRRNSGAESPWWLLIAVVLGLAVAWTTTSKKRWAPVTAPIYAFLEGFVIGEVTIAFENNYHGIAIQAIVVTFLTFGCLLVAYRAKLIRVTTGFSAILAVGTSAIALFYLASGVLAAFKFTEFSLFSGGAIGTLISIGVVMIASLSLVEDFSFIEQCGHRNLPRYMEWYAAFGLLVTTVWAYMEILRLLSKIRDGEENRT